MVKEVYVGGLGCVSALGKGVGIQLEKLIAAESGLGNLSLFDTNHRVVVGEVKHSTREMADMLGLRSDKGYSRTTVLGLMAAKEALADSGVNPAGLRIGLISATSVGGMDVSEVFFREYLRDKSKGRLRQLIGHDCGASTQFMEKELGISGFATTINTACSSANNAIMLGTRMIKAGLLDAVIAGGTDSLCRFTINGFSSLGILDKDVCRPFDVSRSGLNLGEGAGYLFLNSPEVKTNNIYCSVAGYANANDAFHQTASSAEGEGAYLAMKGAIDMSGFDRNEIGYINVHGTGTPNNDASEGVAMKRIFGDEVPDFSSTKGYTGHTLGAAGGVESVFSILSLYYGYVWPNLNFQNSISEAALIPVTVCRKKTNISGVLTNSFGFGGNCTSLVFKSFKTNKL
ncbi:MAG: 3-oxoacyl-[acyl-carrier-protein] synthase [Bacteroidetes bacterium]|nr:3-oxoacyl-[acyl-carrier-protein] synthase [Bacteroidota bacterium]